MSSVSLAILEGENLGWLRDYSILIEACFYFDFDFDAEFYVCFSDTLNDWGGLSKVY